MGIRRVKTQSSRLGVLNLDDYEFDPGLLGFCQRLKVSARNAAVRSYRAVRFFFTSFLGLHYVYIVAWSLVLSWILYPERNMTYTDALFQGVSAMTLTGLNTVDINHLKTYQQIFLFVTPIFTHPLTVASFMVFYRLYLYRKKFDDIDKTSKFQSKLRRAATFSQYETTRKGGFGRETPTMPQAINLQLKKRSPSPIETELKGDTNSEERDEAVEEYERDNSSSDVNPTSDDASLRTPSQKEGDSPHMSSSEGSDMNVANSRAHERPSAATQVGHPGIMDGNDDEDDDGGNKIRFGALPRPPSRDRQHDPQEMFRSLHMMRSQNLNDEMDEDDGPALVIKSPRDIEADERRGIHSAVAYSSPMASTSNVAGGNVKSRSQNAATGGGGAGNDSFSTAYANNAGNTSGSHPTRRRSSATYSDFAARPQRTLTRADTVMSMASNRVPRSMASNYLSWTPTVGRNSAFIGLTREQKEELGGVEYRSLKMLRWITIAYFVIIISVGWLFIIPWIYKQKTYKDIVESHGVSPVMFAMTTVLSGFNNCGLCVLPASLSEFWHTAYVPVIISFIVMAGNVAVPIILRYVIYIIFRLSPRFGQTRETLGFLLDHPRRCFMLLFPSTTTWWLVVTIIVFILVEVSLFMILDHGDHSPQPNMEAGPRLLSAYFQSIAVRTVGFTLIDISVQAPGMHILNIVMMYIAIYPVAMSIRKSNVYEEQTLGHYYAAPKSESTFSDQRSVNSNAVEDDDDDYDGNGNGNNDETNSGRGGGGTSRMRRGSNNNGIGANNNAPEQNEGFLKRMRRLSNLTGDRRSATSAGYDDDGNDDQIAYNDAEEEDDEDDRPSTLVDHMRRQLSMDIWSLVLGLMLIAISEGGSITRGKYSLFAVVFEVVSAHGTIGWSMGLPGATTSLCGGFSNVGKLVMMAIMIRGRHRAMPYNVDRAIILKGADLLRRDKAQENRVRDARVMTHQEPSQTQWLPERVATTASRLTSIGTLRRRSSLSRHNTQMSNEQRHASTLA